MNPSAIDLLEKILMKLIGIIYQRIHQQYIYLKKHQDKINWNNLSKNPNIFEIDYDFLRDRLKNSFGEELMMNRFHPENFEKWTGWGFDI